MQVPHSGHHCSGVRAAGAAIGIALDAQDRIAVLRADVSEIKKTLNIPAEPEKAEAK